MKIDFVEIKNFRKLQCCRIDFDNEKTLLVGANNSGKTSAMLALSKFLCSPESLETTDISIVNWSLINQVGNDWESNTEHHCDLNDYLPLLDVWLDVPLNQIHHVIHIIPSADWSGGPIGVRLKFEVDDIDKLRIDYLERRSAVREIESQILEEQRPSVSPRNLVEFLEKSLSALKLRAYSLDPEQRTEPDSKGRACIQSLPVDALQISNNPFQELINIREIPAMRDFSVGGSSPSPTSEDNKSGRIIRTLSDHVRVYYDQHIDPPDEINADNINAFSALQKAEKAFDRRLKSGFSNLFGEDGELADLGIPGVNNPSIVVNTKFRSFDGLSHASAVQYKISDDDDEQCLPEAYAGLGYQNLIAMVFLLMRFRQDWIEPRSNTTETAIAPLQLVMIEEPEAHLHVQVQQVFIKKAYDVLRKHPDLRDENGNERDEFATQLLVSTHSSHIAHEVDFANLRYFRRIPSEEGQMPISTVINLSNVFGEDTETLRFVKRYIRATDCDLFFADGAIFVEGQAERILVPHLIRNHYGELWQRYVSLIDVGGSNARRFEPLIKLLGLTSLVITDLDACLPTRVPRKGGGMTTVNKKTKPMRGASQVTTNPTLKSWHPNLTIIDELLSENASHYTRIDDEYDLYMAYQKPIVDPDNASKELIPRTLEDALVYANFSVLGSSFGSSTTQKITELVQSNLSGEELEDALFSIVDKAEKAAFAIDCLVDIEDGANLVPPPYIATGLEWLQDKLKESDAAPIANAQEVSNG